MMKTCMTVILASFLLSACGKTSSVPPYIAGAEVHQSTDAQKGPSGQTLEELEEVVIVGERIKEHTEMSQASLRVARTNR